MRESPTQTRLRRRRRLKPIGNFSELTVDVVASLADEEAKRAEGYAQSFFSQDALEDFDALHVDVRLGRRVGRHP